MNDEKRLPEHIPTAEEKLAEMEATHGGETPNWDTPKDLGELALEDKASDAEITEEEDRRYEEIRREMEEGGEF